MVAEGWRDKPAIARVRGNRSGRWHEVCLFSASFPWPDDVGASSLQVLQQGMVRVAESDFLVTGESVGMTDGGTHVDLTGADDMSQAIGIPPQEMTPNVRKAIVRLLDELERLRVELSETRSRIEYLERLADQDALAPVANRRAFMRELGRTIAYSSRHKIDSSVVYFDLNKMKQINDRYGHAIGDAALLHVASILLKRVRNSDLIGRLGGDEFGLIMPNSDREGAVAKATRIAQEIGSTPISAEGRPLLIDGEQIFIAVSFGVHHVAAEDDATSALAKADKAMYVHKRRGSAA